MRRRIHDTGMRSGVEGRRRMMMGFFRIQRYYREPAVMVLVRPGGKSKTRSHMTGRGVPTPSCTSSMPSTNTTLSISNSSGTMSLSLVLWR